MGRLSRLNPDATENLTKEALTRRRLKDMVAHVRDEAHWKEIVASAADDETREELEHVVAKMLPFRCCQNKACTSGDAGIWIPTLLLRSVKGGKTSRAQVTVRVCSVCRERIRATDVITADTWTRIVTGHIEAGSPIPVLDLTTLTFDPIA